jgi:putative Mn2+ efflux pump MntP
MKWYVVEPEVAGGFGPNSILDPSVRPPLVTRFNYEFDVWLGDPILEAIGCFIVTQSLRRKSWRSSRLARLSMMLRYQRLVNLKTFIQIE